MRVPSIMALDASSNERKTRGGAFNVAGVLAIACFLARMMAPTEAHATAVYIHVNDDDGGGHYAMSEYGPNHIVSTIQGTANQVDARAWHDSYFVLSGPTTTTASITYSLALEATALHGASAQAYTRIRVWEYHPTFGNLSQEYVDELQIVFHDTEASSAQDEKIDFTVDLPGWPTSRDMHIELQTEIHGQTWFDSDDAFFGATAYADPEVTVSGGASIAQYNIITSTYRQESGFIPEPTTLSLLGIGLVGLAGVAATRIGRKRASRFGNGTGP